MANDAIDRSETLSGLTQAEAQEFHKIFMSSFLIFTLIAVVAHVLVWMWRPWIPGPEGYAMVDEGMRLAGNFFSNFG
ncbi:MAG: light-harvesting antenna LH1, beta subunit [Henriciella sp.]|uniref:light-harvesting antenna LH1, beta subunit n=1 Tax=Henriciella sp. TaxID=1968823 RepID=UPI003C73E41F